MGSNPQEYWYGRGPSASSPASHNGSVSRLRSSEWLLAGYFAYVALIAPLYLSPWKPLAVAAGALALLWVLAQGRSVLRDLAPWFLTLAAFREMNWFSPAVRDYHLELDWVRWDRLLLDDYGLRAAIESAGALAPFFLELSYALVYGIAGVSVWALFANGRRDRINTFWLAYLAGTLAAYALFPYFPSEPPRTVFPADDLPHYVTALRRFNLWIVNHYGIHASVFPSAHVSSAFSAAWGLLATLPARRRWIGWAMAVYGCSVAVATVYGRYHYAVDAAAGAALSGLGAAVAYRTRRLN